MSRPKKLSMSDIASKLNISKNAVSLALSNKKGVSEELKSKIILTAKELGYIPAHDSDTKPLPSRTVIVLVPERILSYQDNDHFLFYHDLIWGLEKRLKEHGYNAVITSIPLETEKTCAIPEILYTLSHRGIILFGIAEEAFAQSILQKFDSVLMLDSFHRRLPCPAVTSANIEGGSEATELLIRMGHRSIGFIGPTNITSSHEERWFGFWKAMSAHGLSAEPAHCLWHSAGFSQTGNEISLFLDKLLMERSMPTAFFCGNDRIALILIDVLKKWGLNVPGDISIVGFDDLPLSASSSPPLTTMKVDKKGICDAALHWLDLERKHPHMKWSILPTLAWRESVKRI